MRHSIAVKFILILLTALFLVSAAGGAVGIMVMTTKDMYDNDLSDLHEDWLYHAGWVLARYTAQQYASAELGGCPEEILEREGYQNYESYDYNYNDSNWHLTLILDGETLLETGASDVKNGYAISYEMQTNYLIASTEDNGTTWTQSVYEDGQWVTYWLSYRDTPNYTVCVYMDASVLEGTEYELLELMYGYRYAFIWLLVISLVLAAVGIVLLCLCAGQTANGVVQPGGLNRMPLDLYACVDLVIIVLMVRLLVELWQWADADVQIGVISLTALIVLVAAVVIVGYIFALAAQMKAKRGYWWKHSVIGFCLHKAVQFGMWLIRSIRSLLRMLPVIWQWMLTALALGVLTFLAFAYSYYTPAARFWLIVMLAIDFVMLIYSGYSLGVLLSGAKEMTKGNLNRKIETKYLVGSFRDFALQLNSLSETAVIAAQKQMKSERMKSELITNVSHDIKTPLTSIINFVDLLQKPHTEAEEKEYLEVLSRQSARMKKLIEDLMEMSKANTGNMAVNAVKLDAVETVNQALGEFADKLALAQLNPVFRQPEKPIYIQADGRLTWRVLSNVLSNAVKYALPGTRLYVDLVELEGEVLLSVKNISREELRVTADELMERFVQGDASRNTEGSGLGLNIARSLMEVQHGQLNLLLDGDLFKVTLIFPAAE